MTRRLKILSFTTLFPNPAQPLHGSFVKSRIQRMAELCDLEVVAPVDITLQPGLSRRVPRRESADGLTVHHPRFRVVPGFFKQWDGELLFRQTLRQLRGAMALESFDLLDVHYAYPDGVAGQRLAERMGKPFALSLRGSDMHVLAQFPSRRRRIRTALQRAAIVIAVSRPLRDEALRLGVSPEKIHIIPNGIDTRLFFPIGRNDARRQLGWPPNSRIIIAVGRLVPLKGFERLIASLPLVNRAIGQPVRCYIAGEGPSRRRLEAAIRRHGLEQNVLLPGAVPPQALARWYSAADLLCLSSDSEGCPNVVLEALACGTPVVASAVGGVPDMVEEGKNGLLLARQEPEAMAHTIAEALAVSWNRAVIAGSGAVRDWSEVAAAQIRLYEKLVESACR